MLERLDDENDIPCGSDDDNLSNDGDTEYIPDNNYDTDDEYLEDDTANEDDGEVIEQDISRPSTSSKDVQTNSRTSTSNSARR